MPPHVSLPARPTRALSPLHRLWRALPAGPRRALLAYGAARLAPRRAAITTPPAGGVVIAGEIGQASGLGEGARLLGAGMRALGVPACLVQAGLAVPGEATDATASPDRIADAPSAAPLILCVNAPQLPAALLRLPRASLRERMVIGYWSWELPVLPDTWRPAMGLVHEIWVPSAFTANAVATLLPRQNAPVLRIIPHPLAATPPVPAPMTRADFDLPETAVIVLASFNLASSFVRKNPLAAIAAFRAAFGDRPDRMLVLKIGKPDHYPADLATIRAAVGDAPNIRILTATLASAERHALTACADIVLSLHRSEGFGLVPAEAMLLGKPVVATGWSGNLDFMDATSAALVRFTLIPARDPRGVYDLPGAVWAEPDVADAADKLRQQADDPAERRALGLRGQTMARARLDTARLAEALAAIGLAA